MVEHAGGGKAGTDCAGTCLVPNDGVVPSW